MDRSDDRGHTRGASGLKALLLGGLLAGEDPRLRAAAEDAASRGCGVVVLAPPNALGPEPLRVAAGRAAATLPKPFAPSALREAAIAALDTTPSPRAEPSEPEPASSPRRPLRVLLAEDNPVNRVLAVRRLQRWGHRVSAVRDGRAAVEAYRGEAFDLVLMDLQMPELDGLAAAAAIRAHEARSGRRVPILALTAHATGDDERRVAEAGMDGHVAKPIRARALFAAIEAVTAGRPTDVPPRGGAPDGPAPRPGVVSEDALLDSFDGDEGLLREAAGLFLADAPALLAGLEDAVERGDAAAVRRAAHTLEGAAGNFAAVDVCEAVRRLGRLARLGRLGTPGGALRGRQACASVAAQVERLSRQLSSLVEVVDA